MSTIDFWDTQAQRHLFGYTLAHGSRLERLYPGRGSEVAAMSRRHATAWAKEIREMATAPPDDGKYLWKSRMVMAEAEMARVLPIQPTEQIGLTLGSGT